MVFVRIYKVFLESDFCIEIMVLARVQVFAFPGFGKLVLHTQLDSPKLKDF